MNNLSHKHFLGFGTNVYPALGAQSSLAQCENDVIKLAKTMQDFLGYTTEVFVADQTTKESIIKVILSRLISLENLAEETGKQTILVIEKSSHGSQQPCKNGDEDDKADECWMCFDTKWNSASNMWDNAIIDDELVTILKGVDPKKCLVVVISDTCNSGTFTRSLVPQIINNRKFIFPRNNKTYSIRKLADKVKNGRRKRSLNNQYYVEISEIVWMLFAGANADTFSYETSAGGILTSTIIEYIRAYRRDIGSVDSAAQWIAKEVRNKNSQQYAHIECPKWFLEKRFLGTDDYPKKVAVQKPDSIWKKLWNKIIFWK